MNKFQIHTKMVIRKKSVKKEQGRIKVSKTTRLQKPKTAISDPEGFPIVGIGASAGGLNAIELFFKAMTADKQSGIAYIIVQHLDPEHKSILSELVSKYTRMDVHVIEDGMKVQPNNVYIIPPNCDMAFFHGSLQLMKPVLPRGLRLPIDFFFRSLAEDLHERAICIILSGTGTDGTLGLKAIKGEGGMAIVQSPESAAYNGMPSSAISTGLVDFVLPPEQMPEQLEGYVQRVFRNKAFPITSTALRSEDTIKKIFFIIRNQTGHDFSNYKPSTINRRVQRRMAVNKIEHIEEYILYLKNNPIEVETLFRELLIGVTNFFRDPKAFYSLKENLVPKLFDNKPAGSAIRIWIPACSTGEEAYSFAILMKEYMDNKKQNYNVQIFATDIDSESIEKARSGFYPDNIAADVSPERLTQFFIRENNIYRIHKTIRDMVVFAKQDIIKDPPFTKLDAISCRNLLIYFGNELQKKMIPLFHYALNPNGFLFLGNSETVAGFNDIFTALDKKWKIYRRKGMEGSHTTINTVQQPFIDGIITGKETVTAPEEIKSNVRELLERYLLEDYAPPCVIINADFEVLYVHGHTGKYLEPASGDASLKLTRMIREGLKMELTAAVRKVITKHITVRYNGLHVKSNGHTTLVNLVVQPFKKPDSLRNLIMVIFEEVPANAAPEAILTPPVTNKDQWISNMERELRTKDEYLQTTVEELETSNEELKSTNEELQSANEELQSANEELETSKEELQSVNEELNTVNAELQQKIEELSRVNNDMNNLLASTGIGTIFIDQKLYIQRFTPAATHIIKLIQTDINRPVSDIVSRLTDYTTLAEDIKKVLDTLIPIEAKVRNTEGRNYSMRIQPYRTLENVIEGVVLTFVEINEKQII